MVFFMMTIHRFYLRVVVLVICCIPELNGQLSIVAKRIQSAWRGDCVVRCLGQQSNAKIVGIHFLAAFA